MQHHDEHVDSSQRHKYKPVSYLMRYFHYAIILFLTNSLANSIKYREQCSEVGRHYSIVYNGIALAMVILNVVGLCYINYKEGEVGSEAAICVAVSGLMVGAIVVMTWRASHNSYEECIQIQFIEKQALFSSFRVIFMEMMLVFACNTDWVMRYNNSPGNIIWGYMFLTTNWGMVPGLSTLFRLIGWLEIVICAVSFLMNMLPHCVGIPSYYRKALRYWWMSCLVVMLVVEVASFFIYMAYDFDSRQNSHGANRMMQIFLSCNLVDMLFWEYGYLVVTYSKPAEQQLAEIYERELEEQQHQNQHISENKYPLKLGGKMLKRAS